MDKQKEILEMAKAMETWAYRNAMLWHEGHAKSLAEALLEKYQPKIPENAVVLTREEYDLLNIAKKTWASDGEEVQASTLIDTLKRVRKAERKETAEKFAERLKEMRDYDERLCDIADKICKEITEGNV